MVRQKFDGADVSSLRNISAVIRATFGPRFFVLTVTDACDCNEPSRTSSGGTCSRTPRVYRTYMRPYMLPVTGEWRANPYPRTHADLYRHMTHGVSKYLSISFKSHLIHRDLSSLQRSQRRLNSGSRSRRTL